MKVIMYPAITLDGFIADENGLCADWIEEADDAMYQEAMRKCGADISGSTTYEQYPSDYAARSGIMSFVCTTKTTHQDTDKIKFVSGTPAEILKRVEGYGFSEVILSGGGEINGQFADAGLVDEIIISIYALTLGSGIPLFGSYKPKLKLELLETSTGNEGIVVNQYRVVK